MKNQTRQSPGLATSTIMSLSRADVTSLLRVAADSYLLRLGYSCHHELGVSKWGTLRADILAARLNCDIAIAEIKSSVADFQTDKKWTKYLEFCNYMWFVFSDDTFTKLNDKGLLAPLAEHGVGVLVLSHATGYLLAKKKVTRRHMRGATKKLVLARMAWRAGDVSKRTDVRKRVFLTEEDKETYAAEKKFAPAKRSRRRRRRARRTC